MAIDKKIGQLPVETNILNVIAIPGINIAGTNIQISGADIAAALGGITSISSTDTNLLSVNTVGSDSELTIQTAPITKGGTALATADQIVTYVATQTGGGLTLQNVLDNGSTATGIATDVSINKTGSTHDTTLSLTDNDGGISQTDGTWTATNGIETSALSFLQLTNGTITSQIVASKTEARMKWSDTGGTNTLDINGTSNVFTDAINSKGLEYAGAYKSFFTLHSLVDKDYVDTQISSIGTPTLQQVMTAGSSAIGLSSTVQVSTSGSIILNSPGFTYEFGTSNPTTGEKANIQIASGAGLDMYTFSGTSNNDFYSSLGFASGDGQINLFTEGFNPGANRAELTLSKTTGVELKYINNRIVIDASNMTVTDASLTPKGLVYGGAYKANFTLYSLVDKDYVDTQIAAIPGGTPGLSGVTAKTVPVMNAGATAYIDSAVESDGTNVGIGIGESSARKLFVYGTAANSEIIYAGTTDGGDGVSVSMSPGSTGRDCKAFDAKLVSTGSGDGNLRGYYLSTNVNGAKTIDELYGIHIGNMTTNVATTINNLYQVYIGTHGSATKGTGEFYGIYQAGTDDKNYFGGQLQLNHTSGTAGQFLKAVDVDGNAEWSDITSSELPSNIALVGTYTSGFVPRWNATTNTLESGSIQDNGTNIGVGTSAASNVNININASNTTSSSTYNISTDIAGNSTGNNVGLDIQARSTASTGESHAIEFGATSQNAATGNLYGLKGGVTALGTGTISAAYGLSIDSITVGNGKTVDNVYGIHISSSSGAGTFTNTPYGIYQEGASDINYFAGNVGIGTDAPDSVLNIEGTKGKLKLRLDDENGVSNAVNQLFLTSEEATYTNYISIGSTTTSAELQFGMIGPSAPSAKVGSTNDSFILATSAADNMNFINNEGTGTSDNIAFYAGKAVADDLSSVTADLIILGDGANRGNVGIGTETPTEKLDVVGNTKISGTLNIGTLGIGTSVTNLGLDGSGNVVTSSGGSAGPDSITFDIFNTSPTSPDPYTIYDDGNIRLLFDEATTDDIEIVILTNPSTGPVHVVWSEPTAGTSGSANATTASGQVPLNTEVSVDDVVDFVIWAPEDSSYPYYEAKVTVSNSSFTSIPAVGRVSKWNTPS